MLLVKLSLPVDSLFVFGLVFRTEERRTTVILIDSEMLQIYTLDLTIRSIDVNGEVRAILPIIRVNGIDFVFLLITELDSS